MEYSKKYRWALAGLIIMVILNVATLASIWIIRPPQQIPALNDEPQLRVQQFLIRELDLTQQQREQIRNLRQEHFRQVQPIMAEIQNERSRYARLLQASDSLASRNAIDSITVEIGRTHTQLERRNYEHFRQIRNLLTPTQKQQFDRIIDQTFEQPPGRGPGNPRGRNR